MKSRSGRLLTVGLVLLLAACGGRGQVSEPDSTLLEEEVFAENEADLGQAITGYAIDSTRSEARFIIDEVLAGEDNTVVGTTQAVEGLVSLDLENPLDVTVGTIRVDLDTLMTDSDRRNGAIRRFILQTDQPQFQFAVFNITEIEGLPDSAEIGVSYPLQLSGNLTIHGVTLPVVFDGEASALGPGQLEGSFSTTVLYEDFDLRIPEVPLVANVDEEVTLELEFVAVES